MKPKQLPLNWKEVELRNIFRFQNKSGKKAGEGFKKGKYKFFTSSSEQTKFIDNYDFDGNHLIFSTGGQAGIHYCNEKFSSSNDCFIVKIRDHYTKFIYLLLKSKIYLLEMGFKGAGLKHLSKDYLNKIKIPLPFHNGKPDLETQQKIVSILEKGEKLKGKRKKADELLDEYLKAVFWEMFGNVVINDRKWNSLFLGKLCTIRRGASPRPINNFIGNDIPWIKIGDGTKGNELYIKKTAVKITKKGAVKSVFLRSGSLIFANCGVSLGFARILKIDGCIHDGWLSFERLDKKLNQIYLLKLINQITPYLIKLSPEGTQPNLNTKIMKNLGIPLPPIELQEKFANIVGQVEKIKEKQKKSKIEINDLLGVLMQKAFKGELV